MSISLLVKVFPESNKSEIDGDKIYVKAPAQDNKANLEVLKLVSKKYKVPASRIKILGASSRKKRIVIKD